MDEETVENVCAVCQNPAPFKCTSCKVIFYCGVQHQKEDWPKHRPQCRPFVIGKSSELGRYMVASRDIPAHSIIFSELPLVHGPKWYLDDMEKDQPYFPCAGCYRTVRIGDRTCPSCHWPACGSDCAGLTNPNVHGIECALLSMRRGPRASQASDHRAYLDFYRSDVLLVLRILLLQHRFPAKWAKVQMLDSHEEERRDSNYYAQASERIVTYLLQNFLNENFDAIESKMGRCLLSQRDAATMHRICGIVEVNAFNAEVAPPPSPSTGVASREISALYELACIMEHSCTPNCYYTIDARRRFKLTMYTGRNIAKGEHLAHMYTHMLWGTQTRQAHLMTNKYFVCKCARCRDPTELATYLSALKCLGDMSQGCGGSILLKEPLLAETDWRCDRCDMSIECEQVDMMLSHIEQEVDNVLATDIGRPSPSVGQLESIIDKLSPLLHQNHFHLFALKHALLQSYGHEPGHALGTLSDDKLLAKISIGEHLMSVLDLIDPHAMRLAIYKASILYELYLAAIERGRRQCKVDPSEANGRRDYLRTANEYLTRGKAALQPHAENPQEKKLMGLFASATNDLAASFDVLKL